MAAHTPDKVLMRHLQRVYDAAEIGRPPATSGLDFVDQQAQKVHVSMHLCCEYCGAIAEGVWLTLHIVCVLCVAATGQGLWVMACDTAKCLLRVFTCIAPALHVALCVTAKLGTAAVQSLPRDQVPPPTSQGRELLPALSAYEGLPIASGVQEGEGTSTRFECRLHARGAKY